MKKAVNIFIADDIHQSGIIILNKYFNVFNLKGFSNNDLLKQIKLITNYNISIPAAIIIRSTRKIDKSFIQAVSKITSLKLICTVSTGFDNIDTDYAQKKSIDIMNVAGVNSTAAAEFTVGLILASVKKLITTDKIVKSGKFDASGFSNTELKGKTLGIIGVGRIGSKVARFARTFGMNIVGNDIDPAVKKKYRFVKFCSLNKLLEISDIVTVHTPLDRSTRYLLNAKNLEKIKTNSVLINCARGGIIEEKAMIKELKTGKISNAGIDVFENEPRVNKSLLKLKNVILSPHLAGKTVESREAMAVNAAEKIVKFFRKTAKGRKFIN